MACLNKECVKISRTCNEWLLRKIGQKFLLHTDRQTHKSNQSTKELTGVDFVDVYLS